MKLYVIQSSTESGDDYLYIWQNKPTMEEVERKLRLDWPSEFGDDDDDDSDNWTINMPDRVQEIETED